MALLEFYCEKCQLRFEQITSDRDPEKGKCPKCHGNQTKRLISRFAVGGQGDLRESTMHGCHDDFTGMGHTHSGGCCGSGGGHNHGEE